MNFFVRVVFGYMLFFCTNSFALDQTSRYAGYRAPQSSFANKNEWGTIVAGTVGWAEANGSYDAHGRKVPLFDNMGPLDLKALVGEGPMAPAAHPEGKSEREKFAYVLNSILNLKKEEASLSIAGEYRQLDFVIEAMQGVGSGLFIHIILPFKHQKLQKIVAQPLLMQDSYEANEKYTQSKKYDLFTKIINTTTEVLEEGGHTWKVNFHEVLKEAGIENVYQDFIRGGLGDVQVCLGWGGEQTFEHSITKYVEGTVCFGLLAPVGRTTLIDKPFSLPFGSEHHWAIVGQGQGEIGLFGYCALGASLGSTVFFPKKYEMRVASTSEEQGWVRLQKGEVRVDRGSFWQASGYVKAFYDPYGIACWLGVSYYAQGITSFSNLKETGLFSQEALLTDVRTKNWHHYMLQSGFLCDGRKISNKAIMPLFTLTYDYSLVGERLFKTNIFSGSLGIACQWKW